MNRERLGRVKGITSATKRQSIIYRKRKSVEVQAAKPENRRGVSGIKNRGTSTPKHTEKQINRGNLEHSIPGPEHEITLC
jgi:hypothetical protein